MKPIHRMQDPMLARHVVKGCRHLWFEGVDEGEFFMFAFDTRTGEYAEQGVRFADAVKVRDTIMRLDVDESDLKALGLHPTCVIKYLSEQPEGFFGIEAKWDGISEPEPEPEPVVEEPVE